MVCSFLKHPYGVNSTVSSDSLPTVAGGCELATFGVAVVEVEHGHVDAEVVFIVTFLVHELVDRVGVDLDLFHVGQDVHGFAVRSGCFHRLKKHDVALVGRQVVAFGFVVRFD